MNFEIEEIQSRCNTILKVLGLFQFLLEIVYDSLQSAFSLSRLLQFLKNGFVKITPQCIVAGFVLEHFLFLLFAHEGNPI